MLNRRMLWVLCLAAVVSVCATFVADPFPVEAQTAAPNASSQLATLDFTVSDAATGYALRTARISWGLLVYPIPDPLPESSPVEAFGKLRLSLNPGQYVFEIEAPGYKRTRTHFGPSGRDHLPINVPMTRITPPQELQQDALDSKTRAGVNLVVGYIVDAASLEPVSGVQVGIANSRGVSNSQGYYEVYAEVPNPPKDPDNLTLETLVATAKGYKKYTLSDVSLASESYSLINIQLARGVGETSEKTGVATLPKGTPATPPEPGPAIDDRLLQWLSVPGKAL